MHGLLKQARERYGDQLAIVLLPMPLNPRCNKYVNTSRPEHEHACEFARLALAVWKTKPKAFASLHDWLFEQAEVPTPEAAKNYAAKLVGAAALESALADGDLDRRIEASGRVFSLSGEDRILPRLITGTSIAAGEPPSAQFLFDYLEKKLGLKPPP
jgi:hypothetical protein